MPMRLRVKNRSKSPSKKGAEAGRPRGLSCNSAGRNDDNPLALSARVLSPFDKGDFAYSIVVIGASLGGTKAISSLLAALSGHFPLPLAIVLHRGVDSDATLKDLFQSHSTLPVLEAEDKMPVAAGHVYLAPANYHLLVGKTGFSLSTEAPVAFARPAIDVLFESASATYGSRTLGVLLTGASSDGASGAAKIRERGGIVVVQDPATAECPLMPQAAIAAAAASVILPLDAISRVLDEVSQRQHRG